LDYLEKENGSQVSLISKVSDSQKLTQFEKSLSLNFSTISQASWTPKVNRYNHISSPESPKKEVKLSDIIQKHVQALQNEIMQYIQDTYLAEMSE
jgi:hypothetical protein